MNFRKRNYITQVLVILSCLICSVAKAEILRDPIGVNVSAARPMSLTVRFADNAGGTFTTNEALFCFRLLDNGQCDPAAILGRLPSGRDLGSTQVPTSSITDVMTIPYSVIRSTVIRAQRVDFSDFYYVRRFTPEPGVDLGAGPGMDVHVRVTCHLAGPATVPLSLTQVSVYGQEPESVQPLTIIRLNENNINTGQIKARVEHTGTGILEGWWEVRQPGDPRLQPIDMLPEAALPEAQRGQQQRYLRIKRFRVAATTAGNVVIEGPRYSELPQSISGHHEILLRFDATIGRENRARLSIEGESNNLFSGGVAGFNIPVIEYHTPAGLKSPATGSLAARLISYQDDDNQLWRLVWRPKIEQGLVLEFTVTTTHGHRSIIAPALAGLLDFPGVWSSRLPHPNMTVVLRSRDGSFITEPESVEFQSGKSARNQALRNQH